MIQNFLKTNDGTAIILTIWKVESVKDLWISTHTNIRRLMATHINNVFPSLLGSILKKKKQYFSEH